jgi:hypothetical protein
MSIAYYECVFVVLGIQHAMPMRHIVVCGLPPALQYFSTLFHKHHYFFGGGGIVEHEMCVLSFCKTFA